MFNVGSSRFGFSTPPVIKNLLYINALMLLATYVLKETYRVDLIESLALYYPESPNFRIYQLITHMFMHANIQHLFFNMLALWMFGRALEEAWGSKRFLIYYLCTGLGAAMLHTFVNYLSYLPIKEMVNAFNLAPSPEKLVEFANRFVFDADLKNDFYSTAFHWSQSISASTYIDHAKMLIFNQYIDYISIPTVGASGAVYGVLLGFGMLFPNTIIMLIFPPIPMKAKWFVLIFGLMELYYGFKQSGDDVAHFAHLGGMLFGYLIIKYWNSKRTNFY